MTSEEGEKLRMLAEVLYTCLWIELTGRAYRDFHTPNFVMDMAEQFGLQVRVVMAADDQRKSN